MYVHTYVHLESFTAHMVLFRAWSMTLSAGGAEMRRSAVHIHAQSDSTDDYLHTLYFVLCRQ